MQDGGNASESAAAPPRKRKVPPPKLSAMLPCLLGAMAPLPVIMAAMDRVEGEGRPGKTPVLYEFNKLFKLCGRSAVRRPLPPPGLRADCSPFPARPTGVLFPAFLLAARMAIKYVLGATSPKIVHDRLFQHARLQHCAGPGKETLVVRAKEAGRRPFDRWLAPDEADKRCTNTCRFAVLTMLTVSGVRALVYTATLLVKNQDNSKIPDDEISKEFMSDHVFLGISIACLARFELYCCLECLGSNK
jgi:hypothetical protein